VDHRIDRTAVPDPRRSYDRGVWAVGQTEAADGEPAEDDDADGVAETAARARPGIAGIPTARLVREIERRQGRLTALHGQRDRLLRQIAALDHEPPAHSTVYINPSASTLRECSA
jgi:hypothetical protein